MCIYFSYLIIYIYIYYSHCPFIMLVLSYARCSTVYSASARTSQRAHYQITCPTLHCWLGYNAQEEEGCEPFIHTNTTGCHIIRKQRHALFQGSFLYLMSSHVLILSAGVLPNPCVTLHNILDGQLFLQPQLLSYIEHIIGHTSQRTQLANNDIAARSHF